jgi:hypothetical protein
MAAILASLFSLTEWLKFLLQIYIELTGWIPLNPKWCGVFVTTYTGTDRKNWYAYLIGKVDKKEFCQNVFNKCFNERNLKQI